MGGSRRWCTARQAVAQIIRAEKLAPSRCVETHLSRAVTVLASELLFLMA